MTPVRILVVDDAVDWRKFVALVLRAEPSLEIISEVSDGLTGVRIAEQFRPTVVLFDIGLPRLNGIEAARHMLARAPEIKVVFVSEQSDVDVVAAALGFGALGYVLKSDAGRELIPAIHTVLRGETFVSSGLRFQR